jgi:hypothetical protein
MVYLGVQAFGNIGYVGTIGLQALVKTPKRLSDTSRKLRDGNGIKFKRESASGTHSRCLIEQVRTATG